MSPTTASPPMHESRLRGLQRVHQGKVRDIYALDERHMLIVTTDRLSAFDVVLPDPIPGKGRILNTISNFWFARTGNIVPNHLLGMPLAQAVPDPVERAQVEGRSVIARRLRALPIEAIVRGYLIGSGWKDYQATGSVSGVMLPAWLRQAERLPRPIFTPATKAAVGDHDENISYATAESMVGADIAAKVRDISLALYGFAAAHCAQRGIIVADTKF